MNSLYTAEIAPLGSSARDRLHRDLVDGGVKLPMQHHPEWERLFATRGGYLVLLRDPSGQPTFGYSVWLSKSRALPRHCLMRVQRYGATHCVAAAMAGVAELARLASQQKNLLRVYLEVLSADESVRHGIRQAASAHGFQQTQPPRTGYENTLVLDLRRNETDILMGFSTSARRNIRAPGKKGLEIRPITSTRYAERMASLLQETLARTGGAPQRQDWGRIIAFSNAHPNLSRIAGCFSADTDEPTALRSFAWGCHHGDHATHTAAASTRTPGCNLPLSYATTWDLILWAKLHGAQWFDFGGVTSANPEDNLSGISDFKRFFSSQVRNVGEEWTLEPSKLKGLLSEYIGISARWIHQLPNKD